MANKKINRWVIPAVSATLLVLVVSGLGYVYYQKNNSVLYSPSQTQKINDEGHRVTAGGEGSEKYNQELREHDMEESVKAAKKGETRAAIPIGETEEIKFADVTVEKVKEKTLPPKVDKQAEIRKQQIARAEAERVRKENNRRVAELQKKVTEAIRGELSIINKGIAASYPEAKGHVYEVSYKSENRLLEEQMKSMKDQPIEKVEYTPFEVGEVLYTMNTVAINSDVPGPSMVEIVAGPLKGGKLIGSFERHDTYLLLTFKTFSFQGKVYQFEGIAVDPNTSGVAVRSDVDNHYFERWGGLIGASFLEGFADAVENSGVTTESTDIGVIVDQPEYSTEDQMWIAAGKVGENLAVPMLQNFYRAPTVFLDPGTEMGILITKN